MQKILIVASTHGHERIGLRVIEEFQKVHFDQTSVEFIIGNPKASEQNVPYIESDLNRVFPGSVEGTHEEIRAHELTAKILEADIVIDIHSTKTTDLSMDSMVIVTKLDKKTKELLGIFKPPKVLHMMYKSDRALISQAKIGIAFEYGKDDSDLVLQATIYDIAEIMLYTGAISTNPFSTPRVDNFVTEVFEVYDTFSKTFSGTYTLNKEVENFKKIEKGAVVCLTQENEEVFADEEFYPILFGNNRYTEILGFKARAGETI